MPANIPKPRTARHQQRPRNTSSPQRLMICARAQNQQNRRILQPVVQPSKRIHRKLQHRAKPTAFLFCNPRALPTHEMQVVCRYLRNVISNAHGLPNVWRPHIEPFEMDVAASVAQHHEDRHRSLTYSIQQYQQYQPEKSPPARARQATSESDAVPSNSEKVEVESREDVPPNEC